MVASTRFSHVSREKQQIQNLEVDLTAPRHGVDWRRRRRQHDFQALGLSN